VIKLIYTITLNPALDWSIILDELHPGNVNRSNKTILDAGGKGINVSKVIKNLNEKTCNLGFIGNENKDTFLKKIEELCIKYDFIEVPGATRTNIKIVEIKKAVFTDINQAGFEVSDSDIKKLIYKIKNKVKKGDVAVLSGSLPVGASPDIYKNLICILKETGAKTILDAEGEALKLGVYAHPDVIKPNINELEGIIESTDDMESIITGTRNIIGKEGKAVISMGSKGALCICEDTYFIPPVKVNVKSTVGAGDSMVAALAIGLEKNMDFSDTFRLSAAASTAKITLEGTKAPSNDEIKAMLPLIKLERRN
jgi:1-phosphofructokinase